VAEDLLDRDSSRPSDPYLDREGADLAVLALPGSLAPEDHEDPWDRDHEVAAPSGHEARDSRLLSLPARKVLLPLVPPEGVALAPGPGGVAAPDPEPAWGRAVVEQVLEQVSAPRRPAGRRAWVSPRRVSGWRQLLLRPGHNFRKSVSAVIKPRTDKSYEGTIIGHRFKSRQCVRF
jgi:hypothetical protein